MLYRIFILFFLIGCSVKPLYDIDDETLYSFNEINVDIIAERDGQKLRKFLQSAFRDLKFADHNYRLSISLAYREKPYAHANDGYAKRVYITYLANVALKNTQGKIVFSKLISVSSSANISSAYGEIILSLYTRNNDTILKELSYRIVENLKMFMHHEA